MKDRFAAFLVDNSKVILIIFIVLALACAALIPFVQVNEDMAKYLPKDSSMRQGLDLMEAEFGKEDASSLKVMFGDLKTKDEKLAVKETLEAISNVEEVSYEPGDEDYNRGPYTLYIIDCDCDQYSDEATAVWEEVKVQYEDSHEIYLGGSIYNANTRGLPLWIALSAVGLVFLIIMIMASSWIEPVAILIPIGIAVSINMGTYIFFPSISKTSFGIVAILQLALSMDYSIMLLNRYRQQRHITPDKRQAMRESLALSFGAITGSSLTTFAGLLALLFMSFTMGADIGLALAKGVLTSLICIFTVLPALLLGFDSLMQRTPKPTLSFDYPRFSRLQFRLRIPLTLLFIALFVAGFVVRSGVDFSYSQGRYSKIDDVFGYDNAIVMVYNESDSAAAELLADDLEDQKTVNSAVCYESTLGKQRTAADMRSFIKDMEDSGENDGADMDLDEDVIRLIYYDHYAANAEVKLTLAQFVGFLQEDVLYDDTYADSISDEMRDKIDDMEKFTDAAGLTRKRNAAGLASFFGMKKSQAEQLLLYYQIRSGRSGGTMTVPAFVNFLIDEVASDSEYGSMLQGNALKQLQTLRPFTNRNAMKKKRTYKSAAKLLGMKKAQMRMIYVQYFLKKAKEDPMGTMTIAELAGVFRMMAEDPVLKEQFDTDEVRQMIAGLEQIGLMDPNAYDVAGMVQALTMYGVPLDEQTLSLAYTYRQVREEPKEHRLSVQKIIHFMLSEKSIRSSLPAKQKKQMKTLKKVIDASVAGKRLSAGEMAKLLGMKSSDARSVYLLYIYKHGDTSGWKLSAQQFVNFLVREVLQDPKMKGRIGDSADDLKIAQKIINHAVAGTSFTSKELADLLADYSDEMNEDDLAMLYELYGSKHDYDESWTMDLMGMVHHLDQEMLERPSFSSMMEEDEKADLDEMCEDLDEAAAKLEGEHYGRMLISADLPEDGDATRAFMDRLSGYAGEYFGDETYLIGSTPMAYEMSRTFRGELNRITLITAFFIFIIVLLTFRRLATPVILVLMIQCAVFLTMGFMNSIHFEMNYLALLIVQSIMMGATIDYAIVYSTYYVEKRRSLTPLDAIRASYRGSMQTILTSATILIAAVGVLSFAFSEPATRQICRILSLGCLIATLLVIFLLPGILACLDRLVVKRKNGIAAEEAAEATPETVPEEV